MKHALLITVYNDFDCLYKMLTYYTGTLGLDCYVHIDKKASISSDMLTKLKSINHVTVLRKYRINWGSYKHPLSFIRLMQVASKQNAYDFFHLISANTFVGVSKESFYAFFSQHKDNSFVEYIRFKGTDAENDLRRWYQFYRFQFLYNRRGKHAAFWNNFEYYGIKLQEKLGIKRNIDFTFKGYVYCHLNKEAANYVLSHYRIYIPMIKYCHVGEEFFFQNMLLNSELQSSIINDSLIFDDWSPERERPAILNEKDLPLFQKSQKMFLRKISSPEMIDKVIANSKNT